MAHRPNSAERTNAILKAIEKIKLETNKGKMVPFSPGKVTRAMNLSNNLGTIMVKLGILNKGKGNFYQWAHGVEPVDFKLATKVYEAIKKYQNTVKSVTRSGGIKAPAVVPDKVIPNNQTVKKTVAVAKTGNNMKLETIKIKDNTPKVKTKIHFDDSLGVIFGYKQLSYIKKRPFPESISVEIDAMFTVLNVQMIEYTVDKSDLTITFYSEQDIKASNEVLTEWKTSHIKLKNKVLGFTEGVQDGKPFLKIKTIAVSDPFNIQ